MDKFLHANLAYHNSTIYPDTGKLIAQFYQISKEFIMERKERELVAPKSIKKMTESYDGGSRSLPSISVGDCVRVQNQTTTRTT